MIEFAPGYTDHEWVPGYEDNGWPDRNFKVCSCGATMELGLWYLDMCAPCPSKTVGQERFTACPKCDSKTLTLPAILQEGGAWDGYCHNCRLGFTFLDGQDGNMFKVFDWGAMEEEREARRKERERIQASRRLKREVNRK